MLRPHVEKGSIARLCRSLQGTMHDGLEKIFASNEHYAVPDVLTSEEHERDAFGPRVENLVHGDDMEEEV